MKRATLVAATLCVFATGGATFAQDPAKTVEPAATPIIAAVSVPTLAPAAPASAEPAEVAKPTPPAPPPVTLVARIDLSTQRVTVTENGKAKFTWPISSGAQGFATPTGNFRPQWSAKMWYSRKYDMAPMPHAVFFNGGIAMHATQSVGMLGRPASHGCIRLSPANAAVFYGVVQRHSMAQTRINVVGSPRFDKPNPNAVATRRDQQPARQYSAGTYAANTGLFAGPAPQIRYQHISNRPAQNQPFQHRPAQYNQVRYVPTAYRY